MKKIICLIVLSSVSMMNADILNALVSFTGAPKPYKESKIGLEVLNKTGSPIWVMAVNGDKQNYQKSEPIKVDSKGFITQGSRGFYTDINKKSAVAVWKQDPKKVQVSGDFVKQPKAIWQFTPQPDIIHQFPAGKTAYITIDKSLYARRQTGPREGKAGKTDSGLSLEKNIDNGDIETITIK